MNRQKKKEILNFRCQSCSTMQKRDSDSFFLGKDYTCIHCGFVHTEEDNNILLIKNLAMVINRGTMQSHKKPNLSEIEGDYPC